MKQKMKDFEESLNYVNIINSITELKYKIRQLESKYRYAIAQDHIASDVQINNREEDVKQDNLLHYEPDLRERSNFRKNGVKVDNSIANQDLQNASF